MHLTIPATAIKLILLTALLWSSLSIIAVVALCSISDMANFYLDARPTWMLYAVLSVLWLFSLKIAAYRMF
jgi:hypothetical protein